MSVSPRSWRYPGWRMVGVAFFVDFVAVGFFFYSYGVFFKAIAAEFGGSRLGVSLGLTVTATVGALAAPVIGPALDRYPLKRIIGAGAASMTVGFLLLSQVRSPLEFYLVIGVFIGLGGSAMGQLATSKLVANWFIKKRGMALGIAATGISVSGVIMPFVSAALIEDYGWRTGFMLYGGFTGLVVLPIALLLIVSSPEAMGLTPDGTPARTAPGAAAPLPAIESGSLLKERNFWVLVAVVGMSFCVSSATLTHMVPRLTDTGVSLTDASIVMSICAGCGVLGKLSFGWLSDFWRARNAVWFAVVTQVAGQALMFQSDQFWVFAVGAAIFGYGMGGVVPMQGALVGRMFGRDRFGKTLGTMRPAMFPLQIAGVPLAGWVFDTTGSYDAAFLFFFVLYFLTALAALGFKEPART